MQQVSNSAKMDRSLLWAGLAAGLVACSVPFSIGLMNGWSAQRAVVYVGFATLFILLSQIPALPLSAARRLEKMRWLHLVLLGALATVLQAIGRDPFLQPIVFTIPVVFAALCYSTSRTILITIGYLTLMAVGLWLAGHRVLEAFIFPLLGYTSAMVLIVVLTKLSVQQREARQRADLMSADLARQRDYLARLVSVTAMLARELDVARVLDQVVAAGSALAQARQVRVWLVRSSEGDRPRLAAALHHEDQFNPSAEVYQALNIGEIVVGEDMLALPLIAKGAHIGVLELCDRGNTQFSSEDASALQPFANAAAVALENAQLYEQAGLTATLAERNRLARELHDTVAQGLTAVNMQLEAAQRSFDRDPVRARQRVVRAAELVRATLDDIRRSVWTLASPLIDGATLVDMLREATDRFTTRTGVAAQYVHTGTIPLVDHATATQLLRIVQEALHNVEKHASATAVHVRSENAVGELRIWVLDNGRGFDVDAPPSTDTGGFGLISQAERARLIGARLSIVSHPGSGTRVEVTMGPTTRANPAAGFEKED